MVSFERKNMCCTCVENLNSYNCVESHENPQKKCSIARHSGRIQILQSDQPLGLGQCSNASAINVPLSSVLSFPVSMLFAFRL
jgi:hypothetical protein